MTAPSDASQEGVTCPKCQSPMRPGKAPFYLHKEHVGSFDSMVCDMCHYFVLTESGYRDATKAAMQLGLIGPAFELPPEPVKTWWESARPVRSQFAVDLPLISLQGKVMLPKVGDKAKGNSNTATVDLEQELYAEYPYPSIEKYEVPQSIEN